MNEPILTVDNLSVELRGKEGTVRPVDNVSFSVRKGEVLGVVGESGSGKSVTMLALMGLLPKGIVSSIEGSAQLGSVDLLKLSAKEQTALRGQRISMIFQDPMSALNPLMTIGSQIVEAIRVHNRDLSKNDLKERACKLLTQVGIHDAEQRFTAYPHQFSGGMRQRVMIAMALANDPEIIIADEPTTALDVTVQAQILDLLRDMKDRLGVAVVFITHDLGVIAEMADRVLVMYAGRVVEVAEVMDLFEDPQHPYTSGLLASRPDLHGPIGRMKAVPGVPPNLKSMPPGCRFHPRCPIGNSKELCHSEVPALRQIGTNHLTACHFPNDAVAIDWDGTAVEEKANV